MSDIHAIYEQDGQFLTGCFVKALKEGAGTRIFLAPKNGPQGSVYVKAPRKRVISSLAAVHIPQNPALNLTRTGIQNIEMRARTTDGSNIFEISDAPQEGFKALLHTDADTISVVDVYNFAPELPVFNYTVSADGLVYPSVPLPLYDLSISKMFQTASVITHGHAHPARGLGQALWRGIGGTPQAKINVPHAALERLRDATKEFGGALIGAIIDLTPEGQAEIARAYKEGAPYAGTDIFARPEAAAA